MPLKSMNHYVSWIFIVFFISFLKLISHYISSIFIMFFFFISFFTDGNIPVGQESARSCFGVLLLGLCYNTNPWWLACDKIWRKTSFWLWDDSCLLGIIIITYCCPSQLYIPHCSESSNWNDNSKLNFCHI